MLSTCSDPQGQLARLERIVKELEESIPTGTMARQFNLRARELSGHGQKSKSLKYGPGIDIQQSIQLTAVSPLVLSAVVDEDDLACLDPFFDPVFQPATATTLGFEQVMAAAALTDDFTYDSSSPVKCMDQLWTQAMLMRGTLLTKVLHLAHSFNGSFPVRSMPGLFEKAQDVVWTSSNDRLLVGGVKGLERGIEKVDAAYGGDTSRLLDVCRGRIVFDSIAEIADCMEELATDPEVTFMRIKSSLTGSGLNPTVNSGFRLIRRLAKPSNPEQSDEKIGNFGACVRVAARPSLQLFRSLHDS